MEPEIIYLDNAATTPVDPRVVEAMLPYFYDLPGNAASRTHAAGWRATEAVTHARGQVAGLLGAQAAEIVFTSGATEAINLAIRGTYATYRPKGRHIITVRTEHRAVLDTCADLAEQGADVTYLDVDADGLLNLEELAAAIREDTILVCVMWANNETGVVQDVAAIGELCARRGVFFFTDATQAVGKLPISLADANVHLLACSAHKFYGPKGVGALYVRGKNPPVRLAAQQTGGGHERGRRSGTLNVPGIVGMGMAAALAAAEMEGEAARLTAYRDDLQERLLNALPEVSVNGNRERRLPHLTNLHFLHADAEDVMRTFNRVLAVSSGSACTSAALHPSHVLRAMGRIEDEAHAALRISFGRFNCPEDVEAAARHIIKGVELARVGNPLWQG